MSSKKAEQDTEEIALYLALDEFDAEDLFREDLDDAYALLADTPGIGAGREFKNSSLSQMRMLRLRRFQNHLVFYQPVPDGLLIVRVLHGARDIAAFFEDEDIGGA